MRALSLVVAALLLTGTMEDVVAAENTGQKSKTAQKLLATLNMFGMNSQEVKDLVAHADAKIDNGYYYFQQEQLLGGQLSLRMGAQRLPSMKQLELHYAPKDSHFSVSAHTDSIFVRYRVDLYR